MGLFTILSQKQKSDRKSPGNDLKRQEISARAYMLSFFSHSFHGKGGMISSLVLSILVNGLKKIIMCYYVHVHALIQEVDFIDEATG